MNMPADVVEKLARTVQPLVFETGIADTPYSILGSAFLVGYKGRPYVLTTRHALDPKDTGPICIFPSDTSQHLVPLRDAFVVPKDKVPDDFADIVVIAIDRSRVTHPEVAQATLIDLTKVSGAWKNRKREFVIFGFPQEQSFVDYDEQMLHTNRIVLHARYIGPSTIPYLHEIEVTSQSSLTTFSGLSGGPVFSWGKRGATSRPIFCGMAIRGSPSGGRMHFLDRSVLLDALKVKRASETQ
jgi:hypothetical protein